MKLGVNNGVNPETTKLGVTQMEGGPSKIKRQITASEPQKQTASVPRKEPKVTLLVLKVAGTVHEKNKIVHIASLVFGFHLFSRVVVTRSMRKAATASIKSQALLPRKLITWPAVRNTKLTIAPRRPGRMSAIFLLRVCRPLPNTISNLFKFF